MMTPIADADLRARYQAAIVERRANPRTSCPTPDALQALITRTGDEMARLDVLDHVMGCADCHHEFELLRAIAAAETGAVSTSGASGRANRESARLLDRRGWMAAAATHTLCPAASRTPPLSSVVCPGGSDGEATRQSFMASMAVNELGPMLTATEVAAMLHLHVNTVKRLGDRGELPFYRVCKRGDRRFRMEDVMQFLARNR